MVVVAAIKNGHVQGHAAGQGKGFEKVRNQLGVQLANGGLGEGSLKMKFRTARNIQNRAQERFIHGHIGMGITHNAFSISQSLQKAFAQSQRHIFCGVVAINVQVAFTAQVEIKQAMKRPLFQHVVEIADAGFDLKSAGAIELQFQVNGCFFGGAFFLDEAGHRSHSRGGLGFRLVLILQMVENDFFGSKPCGKWMGGVFAQGDTIGAFSWRNQVFCGNALPFSSTQTISMNRYKPAWWLRNPHAQTIWASLVRKAPQVPTHREQLELPDGDFLDLRWTKTAPSPTVVVLHGLEGCFESNYIQGILFAIHQKGWRGVLVHFRNCGPLPNRLARSYHAGDTADLEFVVHAIQERNPKVPLAVLGYSLGGNALLKWLGEKGPSVPVQGAVAVSVPFVLEQAMRRLETGFSRVYQWYFLRLLKRSALRKAALLPEIGRAHV